jgi:hypothetical protein
MGRRNTGPKYNLQVFQLLNSFVQSKGSGLFEKHNRINRLEACCIDRLRRHDLLGVSLPQPVQFTGGKRIYQHLSGPDIPAALQRTYPRNMASLKLQPQLKRDHAGRAITAQTDAE